MQQNTNGQMRQDHEPRKQVEDDEGTVDQQLKTRIIDARKRVDQAEEAIFVKAATDPQVAMQREEMIMMWGTIVKQFLRTIEPILRDDDVEGAERFYEEVKIGEVVMTPPASDGYEFNLIEQMRDMSEQDIRRALDLGRGADIPEPKPRVFRGLKSIIEADDFISAGWTIKVDATGPPPEHEYAYPQARMVIPKSMLEDAVRYADRFLQQAGVGLDLADQSDTKWGYFEVSDDHSPPDPEDIDTHGNDDE